MKNRFTTFDLQAALAELSLKAGGLRLANIYDVDSKTFLLKMAQPDTKCMVLVESGIRIHTTEYDWPKNITPSGFSMKCRKHLRTKRLASIAQVGVDRIIDMTFGFGEATNHLILELYDRGNIILTDGNYIILALLRVRTDEDDVRFAVRERYPLELARQPTIVTMEGLVEVFGKAKEKEPLRKHLNPYLSCGPAVVEHCLLSAGFPPNASIGAGCTLPADYDRLLGVAQRAENFYKEVSAFKGVIIMKQSSSKLPMTSETAPAQMFDDFHPYLFAQHASLPHREFSSFNEAVDTFFSQIESQKLDQHVASQEQAAFAKLENVKNDHKQRIDALQRAQILDMETAETIIANQEKVDRAIQIIQSAIAASMTWDEIQEMVDEAKDRDDPVAAIIAKLHLATNQITVSLPNAAYFEDENDDAEDLFSLSEEEEEEQDDEEEEDHAKDKKSTKAKKKETKMKNAKNQKEKDKKQKVLSIKLDLAVNAFTNAEKYFNERRVFAVKEVKTIEGSEKALKSAERKTREELKQVAVKVGITKARKPYWFEKFLWFVSSENYLVIAGRDRQQNEILVKKYLKKGDVYVHADIHGASSCIIKNSNPSKEIPPRTLEEAGAMAIVFSSAWEAKISTSAWWVYPDQVSKTAPSGEYLTTGSFMIRGKKNFLPPCQLVIGFGVLFKVDESCIPFHIHERRPRVHDESDMLPVPSSSSTRVLEIEQTTDPSPSEKGNGDVALDVGSPTSGLLDQTRKLTLDDDLTPSSSTDPTPSSSVKKPGHPSTQPHQPASQDADIEYPDTEVTFSMLGGVPKVVARELSREVSRDESSTPTTPSEKGGKPRMSAKQRKMLKKGKPQPDQTETIVREEAASEDVEEENPSALSSTSPKPQSESSGEDEEEETKEGGVRDDDEEEKAQTKGTQQAAPLPRGKRTKAKKMKDKYADQDEDERAIRMQILSSEGAEEKLSKKDKRKQRKEQGKVGSKRSTGPIGSQGLSIPEDFVHQTAPLVSPSQFASKPLNQAKKGSQQKGQKKGNPNAPSSSQGQVDIDEKQGPDNEVDHPASLEDDEEVKRLLAEEKVAILEEEDKEGLSYLDSLTGCPREDDILIYAIPVCAPYSALLSYKFKAKMVPGSGRKGQVGRTAMHEFMKHGETLQREKDLLKAIKDEEINAVLPGKVKLMTGKR